MDLAYSRNAKEALGFYLAWLFAVILCSGIIGFLFGSSLPSHLSMHSSFASGARLGALLACLICTAFSVLICYKKHLFGEFSTVLFVLSTALLGAFGGSIIGLIIPAYLTTRKTKGQE